MAWTDEFTDRGAFRGVGFWAQTSEISAGRRTVRHDIPGLGAPTFEDNGLAAREYQIEALLVGAFYNEERDRLLNALEQPGKGTLSHPWLGDVEVVIPDKVRVSETTANGGMARITFTAVLVDPVEISPVEPDTSAELIVAADAADSALGAFFEAVFDAVDTIEDVRDSIVGTISRATAALNKARGAIDSALSIITDVGAAVSDFADAAASLILAPADLVNDFRSLAGSIVGAVNTVTNALGTVANVFGAGGSTSSTQGSTAGLIATQAAATADELSVFSSSRALDGYRVDVLMRAMRELGGTNRALEVAQGQGDPPPSAQVDGTADTGPLIFGDAEPVIPETTPTRQQEKANQDAFVDLFRGTVTTAGCRQLASMDFDTVEQAQAVRDEVAAQLDSLADGATDDALYQAYVDLRTALVRHINRVSVDLPRLTDYTPPESTPALVLAHLLYNDPRRDLEIVRRNRVAYPGAVTGGVAIKVVVDG